MQMHALTSAGQGMPNDLAPLTRKLRGHLEHFPEATKPLRSEVSLIPRCFSGPKYQEKGAIIVLFCSGLCPVTHRPAFGHHPSAIPFQEHILFRICCNSLWILGSRKTDAYLMLLDCGNFRVQSLYLSSLVYFYGRRVVMPSLLCPGPDVFHGPRSLLYVRHVHATLSKHHLPVTERSQVGEGIPGGVLEIFSETEHFR